MALKACAVFGPWIVSHKRREIFLATAAPQAAVVFNVGRVVHDTADVGASAAFRVIANISGA